MTPKFQMLGLILGLCAVFFARGEVNVTRLQQVVKTLAQQTMMQQLVLEERVRSDGHSGIKQVRFGKDGTRAFHTGSHTKGSAASMHDHADHYMTIGLGEFVAVLNGIEFRTRHNDYMLVSPSKTSPDYRVTEEIDYPDVPPEVLAKDSVEDQITEMREWFKAWAEQNSTVRDYTKYFKPVLAYMEATWTETDFGEIEEPFESDRHHVSADNWYDLQEKIRYTSYTGSKDKGENYAFLPTKIMRVDKETSEPIYAQWNYRILCHQLKDDLPLENIISAGDFHYRFAKKESYDEYAKTRSARFILSPSGNDHQFRWHYLESLMVEVPGFNNYVADIEDNSFNRTVLSPWTSSSEVLNAGYYHRWYKFGDADAMGQMMGHRGFSDRNLFVAFNTQPEVSPVSVRYCEKKICDTDTARVSYAIPMEIIYLTPLHRWNPYNIKFWEGKTEGKKATAGKRKGGFESHSAFNGVNSENYYRTPYEFFNGDLVGADLADTAASKTGVLDQEGNVRNVSASGIRIFLPPIPGIKDSLRTRYPIFPVHEEGSTAFKEVEALRTLVMDMGKYLSMFEKLPPFGSGGGGGDDAEPEEETVVLYTSTTNKNPPGSHRHTVTLKKVDYIRLTTGGEKLFRTTSEDLRHTHNLKITYDKDADEIQIIKCDGKRSCWDEHEMKLYTTETSDDE